MAAVATSAAAPASAAVINVFNSAALWPAAVTGSIVQEDFTDATLELGLSVT